jgi:hypothetical protein
MDEIYKKYEMEQVKQLQKINYETLDCLRSQIFWLLDYCEANAIPLPDFDKLITLGRTSSEILDNLENQISSKSKHPNITPDDSTEPNFTLCYVTFYRKPTIMI